MPRQPRRCSARSASLLLAAAALLLLLLVGPASASAALSFGKPIEFGTEKYPQDEAIGDLDGDGHPDLVVANWGAGTVSVLRGAGDGTFESPSPFPYGVGGRPDGVAIADFNGDGIPDVAASSEASGLAVLLGTGGGDFEPAVNYRTGGAARGLAVADLNGDGQPDIAVVGGGEGVSILLNNGDGTFASDGSMYVGANSYAIAIEDFNGDGVPDLAVVNLSEDGVAVALGNGDGTFGPPVTYAVGNFPIGIAVGDFNDDGSPDLAVTNTGSESVSILFGTGSGSFGPQVTLPVANTPTGIAAGDLNGDGNVDLAVTNQGERTLSLFLGDGTGSFSSQTTPKTTGSPNQVEIADLNGDGKADLTVLYESTDEGSVLLSAPAPTFTAVGSGPSVVEQPISDAATLSGSAPTGTITFNLYGPGDATCSFAPIFSAGSEPVTGNGEYTSFAYTPYEAGTYHWVAEYSGDGLNSPVTGSCGDSNESVVVRATTAISTEASGPVSLENPISDTAVLTGGSAFPEGSITFKAYGPDDATCSSAPAYVSPPESVYGARPYTSPNFTPTVRGTYRWVAEYSGDPLNKGATSVCDEEGSAVAVGKILPALSTEASPPIALGETIVDAARLTGGSSPTGTITFRVYGPDDTSCSAPTVLGPPSSVSGDGRYESPPFKPTAPGAYRFVAEYSGDAENAAAATGCGDEGGSVTVTKAPTATSLAVGPNPVRSGADVRLTARIAGVHPRGTVTFIDGEATLGSAVVDADGTAILTTASLPVGPHALSADFLGDDDNLPSASLAVGMAVEAPAAAPARPASIKPGVTISYVAKSPPASHPKRGYRYSFRFDDGVVGSLYYCQMDSARFKRCKSPAVYPHLKAGRHTFAVKAMTPSGVQTETKTLRFRSGK